MVEHDSQKVPLELPRLFFKGHQKNRNEALGKVTMFGSCSFNILRAVDKNSPGDDSPPPLHQ